MATSICAASSCTHQTLVPSHKLCDHLSNGALSLPFVSVKNNNNNAPQRSIRCRFNRVTRKSGYSSRRAGMTSNLETLNTPTAGPTSVPVRVGHELLLAGHHYLDVRTPDEFSAGHVPGAVNIPYMLRVGSGMTKNPNFLEEVSKQFGKDDEILVGCQLGKRSLMAANDLHAAGYTGIIDIAGGYSAWTQSELPVEV